jgi:hypothetical protein
MAQYGQPQDHPQQAYGQDHHDQDHGGWDAPPQEFRDVQRPASTMVLKPGVATSKAAAHRTWRDDGNFATPPFPHLHVMNTGKVSVTVMSQPTTISGTNTTGTITTATKLNASQLQGNIRSVAAA